jgi:large subunit ribosomal protein L22
MDDYQDFEVWAHARYVRMTPRKVRRVVDRVRGLDAEEAVAVLRLLPHRASRPVRKLIESALSSAEENYGLNREDMYVWRIWADEGPTRRWRRFGARGRFKPILKRSSHITVVLRERSEA